MLTADFELSALDLWIDIVRYTTPPISTSDGIMGYRISKYTLKIVDQDIVVLNGSRIRLIKRFYAMEKDTPIFTYHVDVADA